MDEFASPLVILVRPGSSLVELIDLLDVRGRLVKMFEDGDERIGQALGGPDPLRDILGLHFDEVDVLGLHAAVNPRLARVVFRVQAGPTVVVNRVV